MPGTPVHALHAQAYVWFIRGSAGARRARRVRFQTFAKSLVQGLVRVAAHHFLQEALQLARHSPDQRETGDAGVEHSENFAWVLQK